MSALLALLEQIREEEASFYGTSEEAVDSDMPTSDDDSDEIFLSKDEAQSCRSITSMSTPSGSVAPGPSTTSQIDDTEVASEFEKGCGCSERCYEQFDVSEVEEYRLSIKELTKTERDMFLMGKLQILIRDPGTVVHA